MSDEKTHNLLLYIAKKVDQHDLLFEKIFKKLEQHDLLFERIFKKLEQHDLLFERIFEKLEQHDQKFEKIGATLKGHGVLIAAQNKKIISMDQNIVNFRDQILSALDPITTMLNMHERERIITGERLRKLELTQ